MILNLITQMKISKFINEPKIPLDIPHLSPRPKLRLLKRGKFDENELLSNLSKTIHQYSQESNISKLISEFSPLINWAISCWEYILSTKGVRYIERPKSQKLYFRGDYKVFTKNDYKSLVINIFKNCCFSYGRKNGNSNEKFSFYLKRNFLKEVISSYVKLENPKNPKQRKLTSYSYLRCIPYKFMNTYHQKRVNSILKKIPKLEQEIVKLYFFNFFTQKAICRRKNITKATFQRIKNRALSKLFKLDFLSFCLLLQIEKY